ncbi:MAG: hypothetical protein ACO32J_08325 [Phycisphaerales bacterium]|jgi:hypothetical protein
MPRHTGLVFLLFASLHLTPALAAPPAPTGSELGISTPPPAGSAARASIEAFVTFHLDQIASGEPAAVKDGRDQLGGVLRKPDATPVFHRVFLEMAEPMVQRTMSAGDAYRATNALMVIRWVRTPEAFELVRMQCDPSGQPDVRIRASAANLLPVMVEGGAVPPPQLDATARRLRETLEREREWVVLARGYDALARMATAASAAKLENEAMNIRTELVRALKAGSGLAARAEGIAAVSAVYRGLVAMRDQVLSMNQAQRGQIAPMLLPVLDQVNAMPDEAADEMLKKEIAGAKTVSRTLRSLLPKSGR